MKTILVMMAMILSSTFANADVNDPILSVVCKVTSAVGPRYSLDVLAKASTPFKNPFKRGHDEIATTISYEDFSCSGHGVTESQDGQSIDGKEIVDITVTFKNGEQVKTLDSSSITINGKYSCSCDFDLK